MDPQLQKILNELKSVRNSVADLKSSLTSRIDGVEKALGDRFQRLVAPTTSSPSSPPTPTPAARGAVVDINNTMPTRCLTQVPSADTDAPAVVSTAPTVSAAVFLVDVGEKLIQCGPIDLKSADAECVDRLSFLPAVLLSNIISRLPVKDAARTAVLSRRWRPIWRVGPSDAPSAVDKTIKQSTKVAIELRASYNYLMQMSRYITSMTPSISNGMVLLRAGIGGHGYEKVLESSILFGPVHAYVFDKEKWLPPIHFDMQKTEVKLRPRPWPSFAYWKIHCANCQKYMMDMAFALWIPWNIPWSFSASLCWISDALPAVMITRAHMLFQFYPSRFGLVLQWPACQLDACNIGWIQTSLLLSPSDLRFSDFLHKYFHINQSAASSAYSLSVAVTTGTADNMMLDPSKVAISRLPSCSEFGIQVNGVQLRPIPWPSFYIYVADVHLKKSGSVVLIISTEGCTAILEVVQLRQPGPPPMPVEFMDGTNLLLCSIPSCAVEQIMVVQLNKLLPMLFSDSVRQCIRRSPNYEFQLQCWRWLEFLENALLDHIMPQNMQLKFCHLLYNNLTLIFWIDGSTILVGVSGISTGGYAVLVRASIHLGWIIYHQSGPHMSILFTSELSCSYILLPKVKRVAFIQTQDNHDGSKERLVPLLHQVMHCHNNMFSNPCQRMMVGLSQDLLFKCCLVGHKFQAAGFAERYSTQYAAPWATEGGIVVSQLLFLPGNWSANHQPGVAVIKIEKDGYGNSEISGHASNIIFLLLFYNLVIEDP
ncbi:unnamed protein product [Urochloa humidicola]